jgi:hypothetical protein
VNETSMLRLYGAAALARRTAHALSSRGRPPFQVGFSTAVHAPVKLTDTSVETLSRHVASACFDAAVCEEEWLVSTHITTFEGVAGRNEYLVLDESCDAGSVLVRVKRTSSSVVPSPSWDTLQIGARAHARFGAKALKVNHAQDPNCRVAIHEDRVEIISLVAMPEGVTLTFNYNTTEYSMAEPFIDWVTGSLVGGFKNAGPEEQQKLISSGVVAAHVLELSHASGMVLNPKAPPALPDPVVLRREES